MVAINGWKEVTDISVKSLAMLFESDGIESIVYTDIGKDGMMGGVNLHATKDLAESVSVPVIASGGVTDLRDIEALLDAGKKIVEYSSADATSVVVMGIETAA
jgi:phosphoribosylformimino-5-aminoimidazole carboxamide ribotide isomerase